MSNVLDVPIGELLAIHPTVQRALAGLGFADLASARGATSADAALPLGEACRRRNVGTDRVLLALERARRDAGLLEWPAVGGAVWPAADTPVVQVLERLEKSHEVFHAFGVHPCQCVTMTVAQAAQKFGAPVETLLASLRQA